MDKFEQFLKLKAEFDQKKQEIRADATLSAVGRKEALKALVSQYYETFKQMLADIDAEVKALDEKKKVLQESTPAAGTLTEQQLLTERREVDLLMGKLAAAGKEHFTRAAKEIAAAQPGIFKLAYHQIIEQAEKVFPGSDVSGIFDPWSSDPGKASGTASEDNKKRAYVFAELVGLYEKAVTDTITPAEQKKYDEIEGISNQIKDHLSDINRISRNIQTMEKERSLIMNEEWAEN